MNIKKNELRVVLVENYRQGIEYAKQKLYKLVDPRTILFLSGGTTPKPLYEALAKEGRLQPGGVALVDERYGGGRRYHENSNERMIRDSGFIDFLEDKHIAFYSILKEAKSRKEAAGEYNEMVGSLLRYPNSVAIMGIGEDGHIAGIAPNRDDFINIIFFDPWRQDLFVYEFKDPKSIEQGGFGERISLTPFALSRINHLIVLAFGENKKQALTSMFEDGHIEGLPARLYNNPYIAKKTILITDQKV